MHLLQRYLLAFLACFFIHVSLWAQIDLKFDRLSAFEGVGINSIAQDQQGFMWFATSSGLIRYDGEQTKRFKPYQTDTLNHPNNEIFTIFFDSQNRLWLGTYQNGIYLFDEAKQSFKHMTAIKGDSTTLTSRMCFGFLEDKDKNIWTMSGYLCLLDVKNWKVVKRIGPSSQQESDSQPAIYTNSITAQDRTGRFWMGTWKDNYGIDTFRLPAKRFYHLRSNLDTTAFADAKQPQLVRDIFVDSQGDVWFCSYTGLYWYHQKTGRFNLFKTIIGDSQSLSADNVSSITEDSQGNIWVGSLGGGVSMFDKKTWKFSNYTHNPQNTNTIPNNIVSCIFADKDDHIWVGTESGVACLNPNMRKFKLLTHNVNGFEDFVLGGRCILEAENGTVWAGLQKGVDQLGATYGGVVGLNPQTGA